MKIKSLQISNVLSFKHYDDVANAPKLTFDDGLNIIIGENGSGKSTALEVINFLFKKVLFKQYNIDQNRYGSRYTLLPQDRKAILAVSNDVTHRAFRLDPNWDTADKPQIIRIEIELDEIDDDNIRHLVHQAPVLNRALSGYTNHGLVMQSSTQRAYVFDVTLSQADGTFAVTVHNGVNDLGRQYLIDYNLFKEAIHLYNLDHPQAQIKQLAESFTLISSYRNYHAFDPSVTLKDATSSQQIQQIRNADFGKSLNTGDQSEPPIFRLVRLRVAEVHYSLLSTKLDTSECEAEANKLPFILAINKRLKVVNLECSIRLIEQRTWQYSFSFRNLRNGNVIASVNSLSAGQKAIIHLVFEAYGRGDLKGGLVIIDEPEIHLHYQFQSEYLQVIRDLNKEQQCQYILVTHSEALINSSTISQVRRFSLNAAGHTEFKAPALTTDQRVLIKILDNIRATYAFFAKKVLLVEGDSDRYLFKSIIQQKYPELDQQIAVLDIGGKGNFDSWSNLFESFGLAVHRIADFDFIVEKQFPSEKGVSLKTPAAVAAFKQRHPDWEVKIDSEHAKSTSILKNGDLEAYLQIPKSMEDTISFCNINLAAYLADDANADSLEIRAIIENIMA